MFINAVRAVRDVHIAKSLNVCFFKNARHVHGTRTAIANHSQTWLVTLRIIRNNIIRHHIEIKRCH